MSTQPLEITVSERLFVEVSPILELVGLSYTITSDGEITGGKCGQKQRELVQDIASIVGVTGVMMDKPKNRMIIEVESVGMLTGVRLDVMNILRGHVPDKPEQFTYTDMGCVE